MDSTSMAANEGPAALIARLQHLAPRLGDETDRKAKEECLQLSKALTAQLEQPENVAVDMIFSVIYPYSLCPLYLLPSPYM